MCSSECRLISVKMMICLNGKHTLSFHEFFHCHSLQPVNCVVVGREKSLWHQEALFLDNRVLYVSGTICTCQRMPCPTCVYFAVQRPWMAQKRFSTDHVWWGGSARFPDCRMSYKRLFDHCSWLSIIRSHLIMVALCNRSPYVIGQTIIFLPCSFFPSSFLLFFSSPNLSGRRLDLFHTSTHGVALVRI